MVVITLRGGDGDGWYWSLRHNHSIVRAGWSSTLPGAWWKAVQARRRVSRNDDDPG